MTREETFELIARLADGELAPEAAAAVEAEMASEPALCEQFERWRAVRTVAHRVYAESQTPMALSVTIRDRIRGSAARGRTIRLFSAVAGVAAVVALFLLLRPSFVAPPTRTISATIFAESYLDCAKGKRHIGYPLERPNCPVTATHVMTSKVTYKFVIPDLLDAGYDLDGVCTCLHNAPELRAVHAHYRSLAGGKESPQSFISLFSVDQRVHIDGAAIDHGATHDYERASAVGVNVVKWDEGATSFALCGEAPSQDLEFLADGIRLTRNAIRDVTITLSIILR